MKIYRPFLLGAILCFNFSQLFSQSESTSIIKPFGIGLHIEQFKLNDINDLQDIPANKIVFSISPSNSFRLEPEIGVRFGEDKENNIKINSSYLGLGVFGMFQRNKLNIYGGLRIEYGIMKSEEEYFTKKTIRIMLGPAIGAEYYLGENFTFGGEVGLRYVSLKTTIDPEPTGYESSESYYFSTDTGLFVRFYF